MLDRPARARSFAPNSLRRPPLLERLEPRMLMAADANTQFSVTSFTAGHGLVCGCPVCRGMLDNVPEQASTTGGATAAGTVAKSPLSALPVLHSNSSARVKIYLDFDGNFEAQWGQWRNASTPVFDQDGDRTTFSDSELATIREIWSRVAEDYAPFNVDVTTQDPGSFADGQAIRVCIGGNYSDWFGQAAGGVAYVGAFTNGAPNVAYVFSDALGRGNARYVAEAASHEAGHTLGLQHQSAYNGSNKTAEYSQGNSAWAPIMGVGYYSQRTTWHNGQTTSATTYQDDMAIIANQTNGFGYRSDDYGGTTTNSSAVAFSGTNFTIAGLIGSTADIDTFRFTTSGGTASLNLNVAAYGNNLDGILELRDANGNLIVSANPSDQFGAAITRNLSSGTYYVMVRSSGGYGNVGQYVVSGTIAGATQAAPEILVALSGSEIVDGGSVAFGSTQTGIAIDRTFTVTNTGGGTLNLTALNQANLPTGFTILSNIGTNSLSAGQSTSFTIRFLVSAAGNFSGRISLLNSDANEGSYDLNVSGSATAPAMNSNVRIIDDGAAGFSTTGSWSVTTGAGSGRENDRRSATKATNSGNVASATWDFTNTTAGQYRVAVTWSGQNTANASNAPFAVYDGGRLIAVVGVSQKGAAAGFNDSGSSWVSLGTYNFTSNQIRVVLLNSANGNVVADAVRIERTSTANGAARSLTIDGDGPADSSETVTNLLLPAAATTGRNEESETSESNFGFTTSDGSSQSLLVGAALYPAVGSTSFDDLFATKTEEDFAGFGSSEFGLSDSSFDEVFSQMPSAGLLPPINA